MRDPELCKGLLERIFPDMEIDHAEFPITQKSINPELKQFLNYVAGRKSKDPFVRKLDDAVREAKKNRKCRHEYLTLLMRDQENVEKGFELGLEQGENGIIIRLYDNGLPIDQIANLTGKDIGKIRDVIKRRPRKK